MTLDLESAWGAYEPTGWSKFWMSVGRELPRGAERLALLVRRLARWGLSGPVDTILWRQKLRLSARGGVSEGRVLFLPQFWDQEERKALARHIGPGSVFVDVGANVGGYSFWAASLSGPKGRTLAVEPDPKLAAQLAFNIRSNDLTDRILVKQVAVGAEPGLGELILHPSNAGENRLAYPGDGRAGKRVSVPVQRLGQILNEVGFERIDALKIDVEGGEQEVLATLFSDLGAERWPRSLVVEAKSNPGQPHKTGDSPRSGGSRPKPEPSPDSGASIVEWLEQHGYRLVARTRLNGVFRLAVPR